MKKLLVLLFGVFSINSIAVLYKDISNLERETVDEGMAIYGLIPEHDPDGKMVSKINIYTKAPFSRDAGWLVLLDRLHIISKEEIIRRDLFIKAGDIYNQASVRDSEFSLRAESLVRSLAVIVPVKSKNTSKYGEIELLVATRDLLSLRPSFSFEGNSDILTDLSIAIGEHNLLGNNKSVAAIYELKQAMHVLSARYYDPRLFGSRLEMLTKPSLIFSRKDFSFDGFVGEFNLSRPLISQTDTWAYGLSLGYGSKPIVDFNGDHIRTFDVPGTPIDEGIERRYRWRYGTAEVDVRRSFGSTYKIEAFSSYGLNIKRPSIPDDLNLSEPQKEAFRKDVLPKDEIESYISLGIAHFHNTFLTLYDYNNFKLAEIKRTGPAIVVSSDFSSKKLLLSDNSFIRPESKFSYLQPLYRDSFVLASIATSNRYDGGFLDNTYKYGLSLVSTKIAGLARIIFDGRLSMTLDNRDNQSFSLGSDSGVRGVKSRFYTGNRAFRSNLEVRTAPLNIWIFHAGLVLFYDVGSAAKTWDQMNATHTLGLGLRVLSPQVSSQVFRIDLGFPIIGRGIQEHRLLPSFGIGQAF